MIKSIARSILKKAGRQIMPYRTIAMDVRRMREFVYLSTLYSSISSVAGDIVECGVGKGKSLLMLAFLASEEKKKRKIWGFDSFEGFPEPSEHDESVRKPKAGEWAVATPKDIVQSMRVAGLPSTYIDEQVVLVQGFFENTLDQFDGEQISLLHVDADLYDSYKVVLREFAPKVSPGGLIVFDEYGEENWPGATKAVDEFIVSTKTTLERDRQSGKYFIRVPAGGVRVS